MSIKREELENKEKKNKELRSTNGYLIEIIKKKEEENEEKLKKINE